MAEAFRLYNKGLCAVSFIPPTTLLQVLTEHTSSVSDEDDDAVLAALRGPFLPFVHSGALVVQPPAQALALQLQPIDPATAPRKVQPWTRDVQAPAAAPEAPVEPSGGTT